MNIEEMKKNLESGEYILLKNVRHLTNGWERDTFNPFIAYNGRDITEDNYMLIHKRHEDILNAYLEDNSVEIEYEYFEDKLRWCKVENFIEDYYETYEYRIKLNSNNEFEYVTDTDVGEKTHEEKYNDLLCKYEKLCAKYNDLADKYISVKYPEIEELKIKE